MSKHRERSPSAEFLVERLKSEHARLDAELNELEQRVHLSAPEERRRSVLKKAKLLAKDKLQTILER